MARGTLIPVWMRMVLAYSGPVFPFGYAEFEQGVVDDLLVTVRNLSGGLRNSASQVWGIS